MVTGQSSPGDTPVRIVTVFRSRLRHRVDDEYAAVASQMSELARQMSGFVDEAFY